MIVREELIQKAHEAEAKELAKSREALTAHLARTLPARRQSEKP